MPIRFRCSYCNQLLGISRRKSGTSVRCPTCAGQVLVPDQDEAATVPGREDANPFVFDRNDFDGLLQGEIAAPVAQEAAVANGNDPRVVPSVNAPAGAWGTHAEPSYRERLEVAKPAPQNGQFVKSSAGVYLSRNQLVIAGIVAAVALVVAFGLGLAVGMLLATPAKNETSLLFPQFASTIHNV
jgi:DNA-directed RNA polymerase subunit RPC12/RpoP